MKRLVVTGASTGFGREIANEARRRGWDVFASVRKDADRVGLEAGGCTVGTLDLADSATIAAFAKDVDGWASDGLDALVNNAGTAYPGPVELLDLGDIRRQFEVNVFGHIDLTQRLLPALRRASDRPRKAGKQGARIVMISSNSAWMSAPMTGAYVASKKALEGFAECLAMEVAVQGVRVIIVEPGPYRTSIWETSLRRVDDFYSRPGAELYRELGDKVRAAATSQSLRDPRQIAHITLDAIESARPRWAYRAPLPTAISGVLMRFVPQQLYQRAVTWALRSGSPLAKLTR
jgi:NAD(P)-dependent dehydrogenase (short-subunit alcohol dehydrogenase family)